MSNIVDSLKHHSSENAPKAIDEAKSISPLPAA